MAGKKQPWEQQAGEPDASFKRFLTYLSAGPGRSLRRVYAKFIGATKSNKKQRVSGAWTDDCRQWNWVERADRYDIYNMSRHGRRGMLRYMQAVAELAKQTLKGFKEHGPADFEQAVKGFDALGKQITAETVEAFRDMGGGEPEPGDGTE